MLKIKEIKTEIGILKGRDSIFIDKLESDGYDRLKFYGEFNTDLLNKVDFISFKIEFFNVIFYFACELDTYEKIEQFNTKSHCSFGVVENSQYLKSLPIIEPLNNKNYKHYIFRTYDVTFNIIAVDYNLKLI